VFRPLFPKDYPYHRNDTSLAVGTQIDCEHQVDTPLVVIKAGKRSETWFSHGRYIVYDQPGYISTEKCYKPENFTWPEKKRA
jgi:hypothetical protein